MVGLNPVLSCVLSVEESLSRGDAVRDALLSWLANNRRKSGVSSEDFVDEVLEFLRRNEQTESVDSSSFSEMRCRTLFRQTFFVILSDGICGNSILPRLRELRVEIEGQLDLDMKAHVESLPLKMLLPLLFCMFPAFLILLLGPITSHFLEALR